MILDQRPRGHPTGVDRRDGVRHAADLLLRLGVVLSIPFVLLPGVGLALVMLVLAGADTLMGHPVEMGTRGGFLLVALLAVTFEVTFMTLLRRSLQRGWMALSAVGIFGLVGIWVGLRGIRDATGTDPMMALAAGVAMTGFVLAAGATVGILAGSRTVGRGAPHGCAQP